MTAVYVENKPIRALRVLVIEDDALIGVMLSEVLEDMGHDVCGVEATENGAVAAAARSRPDLMIVDARLGRGSGLVAVDRILRTRPIPHVFVSADIDTVLAAKPKAVALQKPYREDDLERAMHRALVEAGHNAGELQPE